jgi:farnesyl-diphosphate farnesyltransferase
MLKEAGVVSAMLWVQVAMLIVLLFFFEDIFWNFGSQKVASLLVISLSALFLWLAPDLPRYWKQFSRPVSMPEGPRQEGIHRKPHWCDETFKFVSNWRCVTGEQSHSTAENSSMLCGVADGRQTWISDATEMEVEFNPCKNPNSGDLLYRAQCLKQWIDAGNKPPEMNSKPTSPKDAAQKGVSFYQMLQCEDGHWAGDYGGPHFLLPGLIIVWYITSRDFFSQNHLKAMEHYFRVHQQTDGGWGTHIESPSTMFGTCMCYIALRLLGVDADDPAAERGRQFIRAHGGAPYAASWAKFYMCILGVMDWEGHNSVPPELFLLPYWVPFHPGRMWCHARMVYLPMSYLYGRRYVYTKASQDSVVVALRQELYCEDAPFESVHWTKTRNLCASTDNYSPVHPLMRYLQNVLVYWEWYGGPLLRWLRAKAFPFVEEYMHAEDEQTNYICIGPVNKVLHTLITFENAGSDSKAYRQHVARVPDYLWVAEDGMKMNGYNGSMFWDTSLAIQGIVETGLGEEFVDMIHRTWRYVERSQILSTSESRASPAFKYEAPEKRARYFRHQSEGGWPFSTSAHGWPISDCTSEGLKAALKLMKLQCVRGSFSAGVLPEIGELRLRKACDYLLSMQNAEGGWATYELNRGYGWYEWLNPSEAFGDIMIDYCYVECSSASMQALAAFHEHDASYRSAEVKAAIKRGTDFIKMIQRADGSWYGSWGCCFTYGTWFGIEGLRCAGEPTDSPHIQAAVQFLLKQQNENGGWGEDFTSCYDKRYAKNGMQAYGDGGSGVVPTAWALLGLMSADCKDTDSIQRGIEYLMSKQLPNGDWPQEGIAGVFNRSCGITYTAYRNIFPIWALGRWTTKSSVADMPERATNLKREKETQQPWELLIMTLMVFLLMAIVWGFTLEGAPDPTGLLYGLGSVAIGQAVIILYYSARRLYFKGKLIDPRDQVVAGLAEDLKDHLSQPEGFLMLTCYLSGTWLLRIMPNSYYDIETPVNWWHVLLQLLLTDFLMFLVHFLQHKNRTLWKIAHSPHHRFKNPKLSNAFSGSVCDTLFMILVPLLITAQICHVNCWSYIGFGASYSMTLCLIHAEWKHPWDRIFSFLGIGTPADHHVHHRFLGANFGHIFTFWDRLSGKYKEPHSLFKETENDSTKKQGSYGKVKVHKHGKLNQLSRPAEVLAALRYKIRGKGKKGMLLEGAPDSINPDDILFCEEILVKVSRSFAAVIQQLPPLLRLPVAIFYLVLRALDTVEDEMNLTRFEPHKKEGSSAYETKLALLLSFQDKLGEEAWTLDGIGEADERRLLEDFDKVLRVLKNLSSAHRRIIANITKRMAKGMVDFAGRDLAAGTRDRADLDLYCHYVAGLVGQGLAEQFVASGLEKPQLTNEKSMQLANCMGLFLQMTNIIRDYLEDLLDNRSFWPADVVCLYGKSLVSLRDGGEKSVACMNHLITEVLFNGQNSLEFLALLTDPQVLNFCAVPQVMAIATLAEMYGNPKVFTGVVKIRAGLAAMILQDSGDMVAVRRWFSKFALQILARIDPKDPNAARTAKAAQALIQA